jgi:hypothetical protein
LDDFEKKRAFYFKVFIDEITSILAIKYKKPIYRYPEPQDKDFDWPE